MTPTDLANESLDIIGHDPIVSLDETDPTSGEFIDASRDANACRRAYETLAKATFRDHSYNCAIRHVELATVVSMPAGFTKYSTYAYQRHADDLRVLSINEDVNAKYKVEGRLIMTDEAPVTADFVIWLPNPNEWDALLVDAFIHRFASRLALSIAHDADYAWKLFRQYKEMIGDTQTVDGQEGTTEVYAVTDLTTDVRGG